MCSISIQPKTFYGLIIYHFVSTGQRFTGDCIHHGAVMGSVQLPYERFDKRETMIGPKLLQDEFVK